VLHETGQQGSNSGRVFGRNFEVINRGIGNQQAANFRREHLRLEALAVNLPITNNEGKRGFLDRKIRASLET
jgi:hypothetical protein